MIRLPEASAIDAIGALGSAAHGRQCAEESWADGTGTTIRQANHAPRRARLRSMDADPRFGLNDAHGCGRPAGFEGLGCPNRCARERRSVMRRGFFVLALASLALGGCGGSAASLVLGPDSGSGSSSGSGSGG